MLGMVWGTGEVGDSGEGQKDDVGRCGWKMASFGTAALKPFIT